MEHGIDLKFSRFVFNKEIEYINQLLFHIKKEHQVAKNLVAKRTNYEKCISILNGEKVIEYDPEIPLLALRSKLNTYKKLQGEIPETSKKIIDEIEYVTNLLNNGKS
jgi:hypothetical protein